MHEIKTIGKFLKFFRVTPKVTNESELLTIGHELNKLPGKLGNDKTELLLKSQIILALSHAHRQPQVWALSDIMFISKTISRSGTFYNLVK